MNQKQSDFAKRTLFFLMSDIMHQLSFPTRRIKEPAQKLKV